MERWYVFTDRGRKVTWAPSSQAATKKAEKAGLKVTNVTPAPSAIQQHNERIDDLPAE